MKKFILMMLVMVGGVLQVNAWNYLKGTFNSWTESADYCLDNGPVAVYLEASNTAYEFGINASGTWKGPNNNASITETTTISSFGNSGNFLLTVSTSGYYVFSTNWDSGLALTVRYPNTSVYFYNTLNWENVYMHDGWWNGDKGATNKNALRGIAMTSGANGIYSAYIPKESLTRITFTPSKQVNNGSSDYGAGYENFYGTDVVWNADVFSSKIPLYVPTTTVSATLNTCSYYYGGAWHAYETYERDVTEGNFGTICLPFTATVTGATVYKIVSKTEDGEHNLTGINLESVDELEAGKAYIFKATGSKLTATLSGNYADASAGYGMMGNIGATIKAPKDSYIVSSNQLRKVSVADAVNVGKYKGYVTLTDINVATSRSANFIGFDEETTGIESIANAKNANVVYNLNGQRVTDRQKGLVIVNGKKMLRK